MATLYELTKLYRDFEWEVDEETGEITNADDLDMIEMARDVKIENIALWIKNLRSDIEAYKTEKKVFELRAKQAERQIEKLEWILRTNLAPNEKFTTSKVKLSWRSSEIVNVINENLIPEEYIRVKTETAPNKTAIKKAIKEGELISGVELLQVENLQIK